jgi:hypothetical protein
MNLQPVYHRTQGHFEVSFYVNRDGSIEALVVDGRGKTTPAFLVGEQLRRSNDVSYWRSLVTYMDGVKKSLRFAFVSHHLIREDDVHSTGLPYRFEALAYKVVEKLQGLEEKKTESLALPRGSSL